MTREDKEKWDRRYANDMGDRSPSKIVQLFHDRITPGRALDIACGNGRNALFLAKKGFKVDAVDISSLAIRRLEGKHPGINPICRDLDTWPIPKDTYALILNIRFLDRRLFPLIKQALTKGGLLIFESYVGSGRRYTLKSGELPKEFAGFRILHYKEKPLPDEAKFHRSVAFVAVKPDHTDIQC